MNMKKVIKWTNKFSGEFGFVKEFKSKEGHFVNTPEIKEAKQYSSERVAKGIITKLIKVGEGENNIFELV